MPTPSLPARRPAETAPAAVAVAGLIADALGWDPSGATVLRLAIVLGLLPGFVTWCVERRR